MKKVKLKLEYDHAETICFEVKKAVEFHKDMLLPLDIKMLYALLEEVYASFAAKTVVKYEKYKAYNLHVGKAIALRMLLHSKIPPAEQAYKYDLYQKTITFIDKSI